MAWRYRDRETKILVSSANYHRSRSQGGKRFERFSDAHWNLGRGSKSTSKVATPTGSTTIATPSQAPKTPKEFEAYMEARLQKLSKAKRAAFYDAEYEGPEYETGVDY